jgi:hypothetical protein
MRRWPALPKEVTEFYGTPQKMSQALMGEIWHYRMSPEKKKWYEHERKRIERLEDLTGFKMSYPRNNPGVKKLTRDFAKIFSEATLWLKQKRLKVQMNNPKGSNYAESLMNNTGEGTAAGGVAGAAIGSALMPGVGTAIGSAVGSAVGGAVEQMTKPQESPKEVPKEAPKTNPGTLKEMNVNKKGLMKYIEKRVSEGIKVGKQHPDDETSDVLDEGRMIELTDKTYNLLKYAKKKKWISSKQFNDFCVLFDILEEKAVDVGQGIKESKKKLFKTMTDLVNLVDIVWPR